MFLLKWRLKFVAILTEPEDYEAAKGLKLKSFSTGVFEVWVIFFPLLRIRTCY